ncbi:ABC transporter ATP-binding protein [Desulfurococcaceae archaeon MEX13E-LK6-19]|nr:ABC transporter ATP-binding protein [Desulfurococcaceae archaeon MEX13E-LK6-19]
MTAADTQSKHVFSSSPSPSAKGEPIIVLRNITKRFPGVVALDKVSMDVRKGEVLALLGENGAGKSTLVKILYGIYMPDEGEIIVEGRKVTISDPRDAINLGIVMVSQSPQIIDSLTVAENIILGLKQYGVFTPVSKVVDYIKKTSQEIGIKVDPKTPVWQLSYTQKQLVEIMRAILLGAKVLILDEAITYLPLEEKKKFYKFIRAFADKGGSVILITHKIYEAMDVADRITVLRLGRVVGTVEKTKVTIDDVRKLMFGERSAEITYERLPLSKPEDKVVLEIKDVWVLGDFGEYAVKGVSLKIRAGEVVGIAGVAGNGQKELIQAIVGLRKISKGKVFFEGKDVTNKGTNVIRRMGTGYIPDIPARYGVSLDNTIEENIAIIPVFTNFIIDWNKIRDLAKKLIDEYKIMTPSSTTPVKLLSGGNIMKVLVSRELTAAKKLLIAYNPTRALDEATAIKVRKIIKEKAMKEKIAVLFASEDLDEVFQMSDTIAVMNSGKIVGVFPAEKAKREEVEKLMVM